MSLEEYVSHREDNFSHLHKYPVLTHSPELFPPRTRGRCYFINIPDKRDPCNANIGYEGQNSKFDGQLVDGNL